MVGGRAEGGQERVSGCPEGVLEDEREEVREVGGRVQGGGGSEASRCWGSR